MFLNFLKRALKTALHDATDEWLLEAGLSETNVAQVRKEREARAAQLAARAARIVAHADAQAAVALGVDDEDADVIRMAALPGVLAAPTPIATPVAVAPCPSPDAGDDSLMAWVAHQRQQDVPWSDLTRQANEAGHPTSEEALRSKHRRWREKHGQNGDGDATPSS